MKPNTIGALLPTIFCMLITVNSNSQILKISSGAQLVMKGSPLLVFKDASLNNNGTFIADSSTVKFSGYNDTSASYIAGDNITSLNNFTIAKTNYGVAIKSNVDVTNTLTMANGNLYPNSKLTLKSTPSNTARVAPVPVGCSIIGKTTVERYFPSHRAWRLVTAPLTNTGTIHSSWQNGGVYSVAKGTFITSPKVTPTNGFDQGPQPNYSMYSFNTVNQQFSGDTSTKVKLSKGIAGSADNTGYMLFIRGDRNPLNFNVNNEDSTTLNALGNLQTGTQVFTALTLSGKFTLVGNPYASPIDFGLLTRSNLLNRFYLWDPYLNSVGAFVVFDDLDNNGIYEKSVGASKQTQIIQSGQAFFIQTKDSGAASLTITENDKAIKNNTIAFRPASIPVQSLRANLYLLNADNTTKLADGALAQFSNNFTDSVTLEDAPKMGNINEAFSFLKYGKTLSIERGPAIVSADTLFLQLTQSTMRSYQLELVAENFTSNITAYLKDSYLNTVSPINLNDTTKNNFILSSPASAAANRFSIVFTPQTPLAVSFTAVSAVKKTTGINVAWVVKNESAIVKYEVEKSVDGINFKLVNTTIPSGNIALVNYSWMDINTVSGNNYYRIKSIDKNNIIQYSQIVKILIDKTEQAGINIYPSLVTASTVNIQFNKQAPGNYTVYLYSSDGKIVFNDKIIVKGDWYIQPLSLPKGISKGNYTVKVSNTENLNQTSQNIIIE